MKKNCDKIHESAKYEPINYYRFKVGYGDMSEMLLIDWTDDLMEDVILPLSDEEYKRIYRLYCEHMWEYEAETENLIEWNMEETYKRLCLIIEPFAVEKWGEAGRLSNGAHYEIWPPKEIEEEYLGSPEDLEFLKAKSERRLPWQK